MKQSLPLLFVLSFLLQSCNPSLPSVCDDCGFQCLEGGERNVVTNACLLYDDCSYTVYKNASINPSSPNGIIPGEKNVYELKVFTEGVAGIRAEKTDFLLFESEPDVGVFQINGTDFESLNAHFRRICSCGNVNLAPLSSGCIAGEEQVTGAWFMYGKVSLPFQDSEEQIKFEARFDIFETGNN